MTTWYQFQLDIDNSTLTLAACVWVICLIANWISKKQICSALSCRHEFLGRSHTNVTHAHNYCIIGLPRRGNLACILIADLSTTASLSLSFILLWTISLFYWQTISVYTTLYSVCLNHFHVLALFIFPLLKNVLSMFIVEGSSPYK